ncbi:MAG: hypothetical protein ACKPEO_03720 [Sphaerospermopsis kisseleviana]
MVKTLTQSPVPSHQSPVPSPQSPVTSPQSPVPSPQSLFNFCFFWFLGFDFYFCAFGKTPG